MVATEETALEMTAGSAEAGEGRGLAALELDIVTSERAKFVQTSASTRSIACKSCVVAVGSDTGRHSNLIEDRSSSCDSLRKLHAGGIHTITLASSTSSPSADSHQHRVASSRLMT